MGIITKESNIYIVVKSFTVVGITIFKGFKSDGASIPKIVKPLFKYEEHKYLIPSILHDWMYNKKMGFFRANRYFYKAMKKYNVNIFVRILFFIAVTLFGYTHYKR